MGAFDFGIQLEQQQRHQEALGAFRQAVEENPANPQAWVHLGAMLLRANRCGEAVVVFNQALALNPNDAYAWGGIIYGLNVLRQERARTTLQECDQRLASDPNLADIHHQRGAALLDLSGIANNVDMALQAFGEALRLQPWHPLAMGDMAITLASKKGNYPEATRIANDLLRMDPGAIKGWQALAWVYFGQRQHQAALQIIERALMIDPNNAHSWGLKGGILVGQATDPDLLKSFGRDDWELTKAADAAFDRALTLDSTDFAALAGKRQVLVRRGQLRTEMAVDGALLALNLLWLLS